VAGVARRLLAAAARTVCLPASSAAAVGVTGFEPATTCTQSTCTTGLCDTPAERAGFEPAKRVTTFARLARGSLRPLGHLSMSSLLSGGRGIRTPDGLPHARFQNESLRPLSHSSKFFSQKTETPTGVRPGSPSWWPGALRSWPTSRSYPWCSSDLAPGRDGLFLERAVELLRLHDGGAILDARSTNSIHFAEGVRFELTTPCGAPDLQSDAFSHSAIPPDSLHGVTAEEVRFELTTPIAECSGFRNRRLRPLGHSSMYFVGASGFEPPTPCPPDRCANQAALRPDTIRILRGQDRGRTCDALIFGQPLYQLSYPAMQ
jgi:hypothetical protein